MLQRSLQTSSAIKDKTPLEKVASLPADHFKVPLLKKLLPKDKLSSTSNLSNQLLPQTPHLQSNSSKDLIAASNSHKRLKVDSEILGKNGNNIV